MDSRAAIDRMEARDFMDLWRSWRVYPSTRFGYAPPGSDAEEFGSGSDEERREMTAEDVRELRAALGG